MSSLTEQALRMSKSDQVLEAYFLTLYVCAKENIPPNNGLGNLSSENELSESQKKESEKNRKKI